MLYKAKFSEYQVYNVDAFSNIFHVSQHYAHKATYIYSIWFLEMLENR